MPKKGEKGFQPGDPDINRNGPPTKAERMGLERNLNEAFKKVTKGTLGDDVTAAEAVLHLMWDKAKKGEIKAIEWIAHRFYGKEPDAIIQQVQHEFNRGTVKEMFGNTFNDEKSE